MSDRLGNLLGVVALAAADRLRDAVPGGSAAAALVHLQAHPGGSVSALARVLGIAQPVGARLVDRLEGDGLLERLPGPDRRTRALRLTPAGDAAATAALRDRADHLQDLVGGLDAAEAAALERVLERLVAALADDRPGALHACRMCDRAACASGPGCPLDHTVRP